MKFSANHEVSGGHTQESEFDTSSNDFTRQISRFCANTGSAAKDYLTFQIAKKVGETGKKYNEIPVSVEINLQIFLGDLYDGDNFRGSCTVQFVYTLEPAESGLYRLNFCEAGRQIANQILSKYQNLFMT